MSNGRCDWLMVVLNELWRLLVIVDVVGDCGCGW